MQIKRLKVYKPLPKSVTIKDSAVHGQGLFAVNNIPYGIELGISHVFAVGFQNNYIRTPLGGFVNHSDDPNCGKIESHSDSTLRYYILQTIKDIKVGEELTLDYTMYSV
jgi:SET domain-containing protein